MDRRTSSHPFQGREPKGTKDSVADLLANIRGMAKADPELIERLAYDNDYAIDSVWWQVLAKRDEWDRIRGLPIDPSVRHALFTCAVNHGIGAAIAMLESIDSLAEAEARAEVEARAEERAAAQAQLVAASEDDEGQAGAPHLTAVSEIAQAEEEEAQPIELELEVIQDDAKLHDGVPVLQTPRVIARKRSSSIKPRDYDFGERTLRYTKYQFYLLYRQPWVRKVIRRARDNRVA